METTLGETTDSGMIPGLDQFWTDWQNLSGDPSNMSLRTNLISNAGDLAQGFQERWQQLNQLRTDQNLAVDQTVLDINAAADQVASLNAQISRVYSVGEQPNDLLDQRDQVLDNLAELTGAVSYEQKNGQVTVSVAGHVLVTGNETFKLATQQNPADTAVTQVVWADDNTDVLTPPSGQLKGLMEVRDKVIPDQIAGLNQLAAHLAAEVNALHSSGYGIDDPATTGQDFFAGDINNVIDASTIHVNSAVTAETLAASSADGEPGNNDIAVKLAGLKTAKVMDGGTNSLNDYYNTQVTSLAQLINSVKDNQSNHELVAQALGDQRESVSGVSLDEEAANLLKYQRGYQAAARVMNVYDEMLDTIINGMGLSGR